MADFRELLLRTAPPWLLEPKGKAWLRAVGGSKDLAVELLKDAVQARFPDYAPQLGLLEIGIERQLWRSRTDTDALYATRLKNAWELWPWAGTATGILGALYDQGYTNAQLVIAKGKGYSLNGSRQLVTVSGSAVGFDPPNMWNKFMVVFPAPIPRWVTDGIPAEGSEEANELIALVKKWKSAHSFFDRVVILDGGSVWDVPIGAVWDDNDGQWDDGEVVIWIVPN